MQLTPATAAALNRVFTVSGSGRDKGAVAVLLGLPKPKVDWVRFVASAVDAGIEVSKPIHWKDGKPKSIWRLTVFRSNQLSKALEKFAKTRTVAISPLPIDEPLEDTSLSDLMDIETAEDAEFRDRPVRIYTGLPRDTVQKEWTDVVEGLFQTGQLVDISKLYLPPRNGRYHFVWRLVWEWEPTEQVNNETIVVERPNLTEQIKERLRPTPVAAVDTQESAQRAKDVYLERLGAIRRADGRLAVPLNRFGKVEKVVLFNPEGVLTFPTLRVDTVTRDMIEERNRVR